MEKSNQPPIDPKKLKEADKNFKKGKKALSTGLFKWSPDYTGALMYFEDAAKGYK